MNDSALQSSRSRRPGRLAHFLLLLLITAVAAVLRFISLDRPAIWGDEALTFGRVCGTFDDLLHRLAEAGFAPLHYELLWWIGQHFSFTPHVMRLVPAVSGTLMIPAMYWLTRELLGWRSEHRQIALLVALLCACNAYLLNYSRDAKMYSPFWLLSVVNVASLLWLLRVRRGVPFWAWVASGAAMLGFDALGAITLTIELLIVLTAARPRWRSIPQVLIAALAACSTYVLTLGPIILLVLLNNGNLPPSFHRWAIAIVALGVVNLIRLAIELFVRPRWAIALERQAIRPIGGWLNDRFAFPPLILFFLGIILIVAGPVGYYVEFNRYFTKVEDNGWAATGIAWIAGYNRGRSGAGLVGAAASAFLTAWEWPRDVDLNHVAVRTYRLLDAAVIAVTALLALGLLPWRQLRHESASPLLPAEVRRRHVGVFRAGFWMTAWMVLPCYGVYLVSFRNHAAPISWVSGAARLITDHPWTWPAIAVLAGLWIWMSAGVWRNRLVNCGQALAVAFVVLALAQLMYRTYPKLDEKLSTLSQAWQNHESVWMPRYVAVVFPPFIIITACLLWRLPTRMIRYSAIALLLVVNLSQHAARVYAETEPPIALMVRDLLDSQSGRIMLPGKRGEVSTTTQSYFDMGVQRYSDGSPGSASMRSPVSRYYVNRLGVDHDASFTAWQRCLQAMQPSRGFVVFDSFVINELTRSPQLQRCVTWQRLEPGEVDLTDRPLDALSPEWRLESQVDYTARDHWRWVDVSVFRKRVYIRNATDNSPTTATTRPAR